MDSDAIAPGVLCADCVQFRVRSGSKPNNNKDTNLTISGTKWQQKRNDLLPICVHVLCSTCLPSVCKFASID